MEKSIFLAGIGGQGMQSVGKSLINAGSKIGLTVTFSPLYTFEKRGGLSSAYTVFTDKLEVGSPRKEKHDIVVVMENGTFNYSKNDVLPGGTLVVHSTLIKDVSGVPEGVNIVEVPFLDIAAELGNHKVVSTVILGYVAAISGLFPDLAVVKEEALETLKKKPELLKLNELAFDKGVELARQ